LANLGKRSEERTIDLELFLKRHDEKELKLLKNIIEKLLAEKEKDIAVPLPIFSKNLSPGEALVKFLKENKNLRLSEIAKLLNKKENAVWLNYHRASKKLKARFDNYSAEKISIPIHIFKIEKLSYLESIVFYLRQELRLPNNEISRTLNKSAQVL
jgi:hypothetical protein